MRGKDKLKELGISDEEFDRQYQEAARRGEEALRTEPRAKAVRYDKKQKRIVVDLMNGVTFVFPPYLLQEVGEATEEEIADVKVLGKGFTLEWTKLDQHFSVKGLLNGLFGSEQWMNNLSHHLAKIGAKGGTAKTEAKRKASAENGKKGGRPRKKNTAI